MTMLPKQFFAFFAALEKNNTREWFDAHKDDFEEHVKAPFHGLVEGLVEAMRTEDPMITMSAKDAVFRLHRDVRFSKDKRPYKTNMGASISRGGRKDMSTPGLYFEANAKGGHVAGGIYMPDKELLADIRAWIADHPKEFRAAINASSFKKAFGELRGERNKVMPAEFKEAIAIEPLIAHKQFYYWGDVSKDDLMSKDAVKRIMAMHKAAKPVRDMLQRAIRTDTLP